jgi:lipopolysaccharide export system permease protein
LGLHVLRGTSTRHYIGSTTDLERRLKEHLRGPTHSTRRLGGHWEVVAAVELVTLDEAHALEREMKRKKIRDWHWPCCKASLGIAALKSFGVGPGFESRPTHHSVISKLAHTASRRIPCAEMRLLDRYLLRELLVPLGYCLGGFLIFWISYDIFTELTDFQERKLHLLDIVEYYTAVVPGFMVTVLPVALLLALLYTLTHHARHNEIPAIRAAGVSLWRLCLPYLFVGFAASLVLFALNELCTPYSDDWAERILNRYVLHSSDVAVQEQFRNLGFTNTRERRAWLIGEYRVKTAEMLKPQVDWILPDGSSHRLYAERAIRTNGVWTFFDVKEYAQAGPDTPLLPSSQTSVLAMPEFTETPKQIESEIKISSYLSVSRARRADIPLMTIWDYLHLHPKPSHADRSLLYTKLHGRLAAPWTCLVVVLIAIPFGAASGRRNLFVGVAGSIFICFAYFVLQQVSLALGTGGFLPAWLAAWLPNLFFGVTGLWLTAKTR